MSLIEAHDTSGDPVKITKENFLFAYIDFGGFIRISTDDTDEAMTDLETLDQVVEIFGPGLVRYEGGAQKTVSSIRQAKWVLDDENNEEEFIGHTGLTFDQFRKLITDAEAELKQQNPQQQQQALATAGWSAPRRKLA